MTRQVILMRHGHYVKNGSLSDEGLAGVLDVGTLLAEAGIRPDLIVHSPKTRTKETARILKEVFAKFGHRVTTRESLRLDEDKQDAPVKPEKISGLIDNPEYTKMESVLIVGHQPDLINALEKLMGDSALGFSTSTAHVLEKQADGHVPAYRLMKSYVPSSQLPRRAP